jgi:hypothetical protein
MDLFAGKGRYVSQHLDFVACRNDFLVGQAVPPVIAGSSRRAWCYVLQHPNFLARRDDFLVGQAVSAALYYNNLISSPPATNFQAAVPCGAG